MAKVAINRNADIKEAIWGALDKLEGLPELFKGKYVAIKPNDTWATEEDTTACTRADSVEAVIQYVKKHQPSRIVVTGGAGDAETNEVFALLGIDKIIKKEKVEFFDHNRAPFVSVALSHGPQNEVKVNPKIFEYETLISMAQHKIHYEATVTLTMKNIAMSFPAADYYGHPRSTQVHPNRFYKDMHGFIAGMCQKFPIDLGIIVGHPAMVGQGPIGGFTFESELAIASTDFVAADAVGARILGIDWVRHIEEAEKLGLGTADIEKIEVLGIPLNVAIALFREKQALAKQTRQQKKTYSHE